jgi:hypothetical protein
VRNVKATIQSSLQQQTQLHKCYTKENQV